jgi:hypothetical protein
MAVELEFLLTSAQAVISSSVPNTLLKNHGHRR